jgi:tetrahydromethanopterin S-methyltransferase subunit E
MVSKQGQMRFESIVTLTVERFCGRREMDRDIESQVILAPAMMPIARCKYADAMVGITTLELAHICAVQSLWDVVLNSDIDLHLVAALLGLDDGEIPVR